MSKNISKAGMKFRRILYKLGKYSMFVITVITCYNITTHLFELRAEKIKKEKNKRAWIAVLSTLSWIVGIIAAFAARERALFFVHLHCFLKGWAMQEHFSKEGQAFSSSDIKSMAMKAKS